ncbi:MAG: hypothetical protein ACOYNZ_08560 [Rhodoferax sp.]
MGIKLRRTFQLAIAAQIFGMFASITQRSYSVFQSMADFTQFLKNGLPFAVVFAMVGLVIDLKNRKSSKEDLSTP